MGYSGSPVYLDELILKPQHSLIDQSLSSRTGKFTTNGDGFGVGWYCHRDTPGIYKDIRPAWNDVNLRDLTAHIESPLFIAHVRATTGTAVQQTNCHPFRHGKWLFVHNGVIRKFEKVKRNLVLAVAPDLYPTIQVTTDSELMFHLALTFGLEEDPLVGLERMVGFVENTCGDQGITEALQMSVGLSDGERLFAVRYSTARRAPTLFLSKSMRALQDINPDLKRFSPDARAIVSEPLSDLSGVWDGIPESTAVIVHRDKIERREFSPGPPSDRHVCGAWMKKRANG